jgi:hypothetical protein
MQMEEVNAPLHLSPDDFSKLKSCKDELIGNSGMKKKYFAEGLYNK